MAYDLTIHFRDERYRKSFGGTECLNDELLRVTADFQRPERGSSHIAYCIGVGVGFAPNSVRPYPGGAPSGYSPSCAFPPPARLPMK